MYRISLFLIIFLIELLTSVNLSGQRKVEITINKNIELLFAMQMVSKMDSIVISNHYSAFPLTTQLDFELKNRYLKTFSPYKFCSSVSYFNELASKGFIFSRPFNAVLMTDSFLNIRNLCWLQELPYPQTIKDSILIFIEKLNDFKSISKFDEFYLHNKPIYDSIVDQQENKVSVESLINSIEQFFGWKLPGYHVVLVPMMWPGGISVEYKNECPDTIGEVYIFLGPKHVKDNLPDFGTIDEYKSVVLHEFIHAFITPYCNIYRSQIDLYNDLYNGNKNVFQNNGCPDWFSAVNEMLTRTVEIILNSENNRVKAKESLCYQSNELGFSYLPTLYNAFEQYYLKPEKNISLNEAFPQIISSFNKLKKIINNNVE